jgi:hypothetical protein
MTSAANTCPNYANCPSTHCARGEECRSPSDCTVRTTGRKALLPAFRAHVEAQYGGPLPDWPDDPWRWDERFGGLPYLTVMANRFRDFMAGFDAALSASASGSEPANAINSGRNQTPPTDRQLRDDGQ